MGKSVKIKILSIVTCLILILITGCGGRGVSEESAEIKSTVPTVTYPVKPMEGEMIKNGMERNDISDADAEGEDEDNTGDRPINGQDKETAEPDQEIGAEAVKAESGDTEAAGADTGYTDGSETSGAGEGYVDGQDDTAVSVSGESDMGRQDKPKSDIRDEEYPDNAGLGNEDDNSGFEAEQSEYSYDSRVDEPGQPDPNSGLYEEPEEYSLPEPAVPEPEAEEAGETEPSGDGEVLGESVDDGWSYYGSAFITHYDDCEICCGRAGATTASGVYPTPNHTVAAGYSIPFGTEVMINGNVYVVEDRGVDDGVFDVFVSDHGTALAMGAYYTDVYIRW